MSRLAPRRFHFFSTSGHLLSCWLLVALHFYISGALWYLYPSSFCRCLCRRSLAALVSAWWRLLRNHAVINPTLWSEACAVGVEGRAHLARALRQRGLCLSQGWRAARFAALLGPHPSCRFRPSSPTPLCLPAQIMLLDNGRLCGLKDIDCFITTFTSCLLRLRTPYCATRCWYVYFFLQSALVALITIALQILESGILWKKSERNGSLQIQVSRKWRKKMCCITEIWWSLGLEILNSRWFVREVCPVICSLSWIGIYCCSGKFICFKIDALYFPYSQHTDVSVAMGNRNFSAFNILCIVLENHFAF